MSEVWTTLAPPSDGLSLLPEPSVDSFGRSRTEDTAGEVTSRDLPPSGNCDCRASHCIRDGQCIYGGQCQVRCLIYKVTCKLCQKTYIGQTQQKVKDRFIRGTCNCHFLVTNNRANGGSESTTLSPHLVDHVHIAHHPRRMGFTRDQVRPLTSVDVEWSGNIIDSMKTFKSRSCILCMKERFSIFKHRNTSSQTVLNQNLETHSGCKHKTSFHRFFRELSSTDP